MFSSTSFAEWQKVSSNDMGEYYLDIERIRKSDEYIYYWEMGDLFKPMKKSGALSVTTYNQVDCKVFRIMRLSASFYKEHLGKGDPVTITPEKDWLYPPPNSSMEHVAKFVCEFLK